MKCTATLICLLALFTHASGLLEADDKDLRSRFLDEAPRAWKEFQSLPVELECTCDNMMGEPGPGRFDVKNASKMTDSIAVKGRLMLLLRDGIQSDGKRIKNADGFNSRYGFDLSKGASSWSWTVTQILPPEEPNGRSFAESSFLIGTSIADVPLDTLFESAQTEIQDVHDDNGLVVVTFTSDIGPNRRMRLVGGTLTLNPTNHWRITSSRVETTLNGSPETSTAEIEYYPASEYHFVEFAMPKRIVVTFSGRAQKPQRHVRLFKAFQKCEKQESDFTLTAFGLSEPGDGTTPVGGLAGAKGFALRTISPLIWINLLAGLCLVLGILVVKRKRSRQAT